MIGKITGYCEPAAPSTLAYLAVGFWDLIDVLSPSLSMPMRLYSLTWRDVVTMSGFSGTLSLLEVPGWERLPWPTPPGSPLRLI